MQQSIVQSAVFWSQERKPIQSSRLSLWFLWKATKSRMDMKMSVNTIIAVQTPTTSPWSDGGSTKFDSMPAGGLLAGICESGIPGGRPRDIISNIFFTIQVETADEPIRTDLSNFREERDQIRLSVSKQIIQTLFLPTRTIDTPFLCRHLRCTWTVI